MENKPQEVIEDSSELIEKVYENQEEYLAYVKSSVADGAYYKDALNWYFFRYVTPICDRTLLIFGAIIAAVVLFFLYGLVKGAFPLVEEVPIFISAKDQSVYFPELVALKPRKNQENFDPMIVSVDESVAKHLLSTYVKDRESFDFSKGEIEEVNKKFNRIKNASSASEYKAFQMVMSKDNPNSPILSFNKNITKKVTIDSVKFIKPEPKDFTGKAREFLSNKIPTEAEVRLSAVTEIELSDGSKKTEKQLYLAKVNFVFEGIKRTEKDTRKALSFTVNNYKLFKVRN